MRDVDAPYSIDSDSQAGSGDAATAVAIAHAGIEVTDAETTHLDDAGVVERRRSFRFPITTVGLLQAVKDGSAVPTLHVSVFNVSIHGCGFHSPVAFEVGAIYQLKIGTGPLYLTSQLKIVSSRVRRDGTYDIGTMFF